MTPTRRDVAMTTSPGGGPAASAHTIRLRDPWDCRIDPDFRDDSGRSRIVCSRRFGRPTNLSADERVDLVLGDIKGIDSVTLNGVEVVFAAEGERKRTASITDRIEPRNELVVNVLLPATEVPRFPCRQAPWGDATVALEIRTAT